MDGIFGTNTEKAFKEFQKDNNLISDGKAGKQSLKYIDRNCGKIKNKEYWEDI